MKKSAKPAKLFWRASNHPHITCIGIQKIKFRTKIKFFKQIAVDDLTKAYPMVPCSGQFNMAGHSLLTNFLKCLHFWKM
jgi:hypothetical protein